MKVICRECNKEFMGRNRKGRKSPISLYCSASCADKGRTIKKECICKGCGIKFMPKSHVTKLKYCSKKCQPAWNKGKSNTWMKGSKNHNWVGGISSLQELIRGSIPYRNWWREVVRRDKYTCQHCWEICSGNLNVDHIKPLSTIIRENHILTIEEALQCEEIWDIDNGRVLCVECHKKTDTYGIKLLLRNGGLD